MTTLDRYSEQDRHFYALMLRLTQGDKSVVPELSALVKAKEKRLAMSLGHDPQVLAKRTKKKTTKRKK